MQVQHGLLFLHRILFLGVFRVDGFHLRLQDAGDGRRFVGLESQGEQQSLDDDGQDQDDDAIVPSILAQPVEHSDDAVVNPSDQEEVTEIDLVFQTQLVAAQRLEVVGTKIQLHRDDVGFGFHVVRHLDVGRHRLVVARVVRLACAHGHLGILKLVFSNDDIAEETLLERHPFQFVGDGLLAVFVHRKMVDVLVLERAVIYRFVGKTVEALLLLHQVDVPIEAHVVSIAGDNVFHANGADVKAKHIVVAWDGIDIFKVALRVVGDEAHGEDDAVALSHGHVAARVGPSVQIGLEIELRRVDDAVIGEKRQVELDRFGIERDERQRIVGLVFLQLHLFQETAFSTERQLLQLVLDGKGLFRSIDSGGKHSIFVTKDGSLTVSERCGVHFGSRCRVGKLSQGRGLALLFGHTNRIQAGFLYPHLTDGVLHTPLLGQLFFRRSHEIHPTKEDGRDEDKTNEGVFIVHYDFEFAK